MRAALKLSLLFLLVWNYLVSISSKLRRKGWVWNVGYGKFILLLALPYLHCRNLSFF